ncbi:MAG TPA: hypothetical protein PKD55_05370, partial [Bellilinea sp.]|nr:hypothetical protein [Bellilinea sp.]
NVAYTSWLNLMDNANLQYSADLILSSLQIKDEKGEILVDAIKDIENKALHVALLKEKVDLGINGPLPPPGEGKPGSVDSGVSAGYPVSPTNANPAP